MKSRTEETLQTALQVIQVISFNNRPCDDNRRPSTLLVRHPRAEDVDVVATLSPKENLGVFFPCSNNSYHGVNALKSQSAARDFLYINISTDSDTAW